VSLISIRTIYWPSGRSVADLPAALQEREHLGVGFVSLTEELDLTAPAGRTMARPAGNHLC
jgi:DNA invertase Pin-like site-specific DNA recombinase